ncbi:hypothetical protein TNCT_423221 [Trichonephila clavata]|uniref:RRM domain-containing protein n=1 Tax=Trichonephila clavata TaxID=2740835 RepID=A0A8X6F066_TRICU|nr:hypothetical protein TNCT_423221 [Trichonephila clavata]
MAEYYLVLQCISDFQSIYFSPLIELVFLSKKCNGIKPGNDPYCFVDLADHQSAAATLLAMNKRQQSVAKVLKI